MSKSETGLNSPLTSYCLVDQVGGIIITCAVLNCDYFIHVLALVSRDLQINTHNHIPLDRKRCVASRSCGEVRILGSPSGGLKRENSSWVLRGSRGISSGVRGRFTFLSTARGVNNNNK